MLSYGIKIAEIARGLCFAYDTKLVAMAIGTRGSAMAEGSRSAVVSRNSVTTKHPI